jgi:hypothetical protein
VILANDGLALSEPGQVHEPGDQRPVANPPILAMIFWRAVSASTPVALATVSATP